MKLVTIVAESAAQALAEVHRRLGPEAVVVNVRKTPPPGLTRIWKKPQIELQAALPAAPPAQNKTKKTAVAELNKKIEELRTQLAKSRPEPTPERPRPERSRNKQILVEPKVPESANTKKAKDATATQELELTQMLENLGILPLHAHWLVDQVRSRNQPAANLKEEFTCVQDFLLQYWNRLAARSRSAKDQVRILVGTPGVGKTTCLCKWVTQEVLLGGQQARIWRLDSHAANTAEFLSIHGEILGIPVDRVWTEGEGSEPDSLLQFVDLPGVPAGDGEAMAALTGQIKLFPSAQILLVLNAAYDLNHLLAHVRAFSALPLTGLILTHLDEETRWSKFWNLLLGAKLPVLYLSSGQNVPGNFGPASPQSLFDVAVEH
ncbi:MAG: hypothetical protein FJ403_02145 [Verrucomicrobia bacterium]|nr:hypothetical protein [Verrucomicrobiota bacterium]